jgi:protein ImuA
MNMISPAPVILPFTPSPAPPGLALPSPPPAARPRPAAVLDRLRERIRALERGRSQTPRAPFPISPAPAPAARAWTLGVPPLDRWLGPAGLAADAVHELKPALPAPGSCAAGARAAALGVLVRLAIRLYAVRGEEARPLVWCRALHDGHEAGDLHGPGLGALGLDPARLVLVTPRSVADTLWVLEEALRSGAAALVAGEIPDAGLTPARRLALAAAARATPCLLLTHPSAAPLAATATRWRIAPAPGTADALDPRAPGAAAVALTLERCRGGAPAPDLPPLAVEWCDVTHRFRLAAALADRAAPPARAGRRAG